MFRFEEAPYSRYSHQMLQQHFRKLAFMSHVIKQGTIVFI